MQFVDSACKAIRRVTDYLLGWGFELSTIFYSSRPIQPWHFQTDISVAKVTLIQQTTETSEYVEALQSVNVKEFKEICMSIFKKIVL